MTFANLPLGWVLGGFAALAGLLFALQRLRVRHRDVQVPTTLFWKEAVDEARARVLVERFRHWWAYVLVLAIAGLLWFALAGPRSTGEDGVDHVLLVDGSAGMTRPGRFDAALESVRRELESLPRERTTVRFCGAVTRTVLLPGEHPELLTERLLGLAPEACSSGLEDEVRRLVGVERSGRLSVLAVGDAVVSEASLALLPADVAVRHLHPPRAGDPLAAADNTGITAVGVREAASEDYESVDVLVTVEGAGAAGATLAVTVGGVATDAAAEVVATGEDRTTVLLADIPATGETLTVSLVSGGDALSLDDAASIQLPLRRRIAVGLGADMPDALASVLGWDPAVRLAEANLDLVVRRIGDTLGGAAPALELVPADSQEHAFTIYHDGSRDSADVLYEVLDGLGLSEIDAMELARAVDRPISVGVVQGSGRSIRVWEELFSDRFDFIRSRALPVFVARAVRWLGNESSYVPFAAAGEPLAGGWGAERSGGATAGAASWVDADGATWHPAGAPFTPPAAGVYRPVGMPGATPPPMTGGMADGVVAIALGDPEGTVGLPAATATAPTTEVPSGPLDWISLLGIGALVLLLVEWFLYRTGRMP